MNHLRVHIYVIYFVISIRDIKGVFILRKDLSPFITRDKGMICKIQ